MSMVILNVTPGAALFGSTLTAGACWPHAGSGPQAITRATEDTATAQKLAKRVVITGGGYVEAASLATCRSSTAAWPLGQNDRKSHRRHHSPAVAG